MSKKKLNVNELEIVLYKQNEEEFISLTDMAKFRDSERSDYIIQNWMRTRRAIEFDGFRNEAGSNWMRKNYLMLWNYIGRSYGT